MTSSFLSRLKIVSIALAVFAVLLITKLFFVQILHGASYSERADRQYATPQGSLFERSAIYFTRKDGELAAVATTTTGFKIAVVPKTLVDLDATYEKLNAIVPVDHDAYVLKTAKKDDPYEEIAMHLTKGEADAVTALALPGVSIYQEKWRFYPGGTLASNILGFVGFQGDTLSGRSGLERYYNDVLTAKADTSYVNFFAEIFSNLRDTFKNNTQEGDIVVSIDPAIQAYLDKTLQDVYQKWTADSAGGIIVDPKTGTIYAMSVMPNFDPNTYSKVRDVSVFADPLVEDVFEMGSVVKALTMAAGLDAGLVTPETTYNDQGFLILNKQRINNFDLKGRGPHTTMQQVLNESLNTGATFVMQKLGRDQFRKYMLSYGIGEKSGVDLLGEVNDMTANLNSTRDIEYATASFGQGIALTPVAAVRAFSVLANGGHLTTPHLLSEIKYADGTVKKADFPVGTEQIIKPETSVTISRMLVQAFDKGLLGGKFKMEHYSVAAKTGTAQIAKEDGRGYYTDKYLHTLFGYFPAYDPQFLVFLYMKNPKGVNFSSNTLSYPFVDITKYLINDYQIAPDR